MRWRSSLVRVLVVGLMAGSMFGAGCGHDKSRVLVGDLIFMVNDVGIASAVDAKTGEVVWTARIGGTFSASPLFADGRVYFLAEDGAATVIAPGREFKQLAVNHLEGATLASIAVAGRSFYIRSATHLYRIDG